MRSSEQVVLDFVSAWTRMDFDAITNALTDNIHYHNIPMQPIIGKPAVTKYLRSAWTFDDCEWRMVNLACDGNTVLTERVDDFRFAGKRVSLPVMGVFVVEGTQISVWRDYFDLADYRAQLDRAIA